jgi:hypothetical protein
MDSQTNDYKEETQQLLEAIKDVAGKRTVVIGRIVGGDEKENTLEPDVYEGFNFEGKDVQSGYIQANDDIRVIPLSLPLTDGSRLDSFCQAIVRATRKDALDGLKEDSWLPYGTFMRIEKFGDRISANQVLNHDPEVFKRLAHNIVIVGGDWHSRGYGRGDEIDNHATPVGEVSGAYIHANYVEALLVSGIAKPWGGKVGKGIEILLSFGVALIFYIKLRPWKRLVAILGFIAAMILFSYLSWQNFGLFFDFLIPAFLLSIHYLYEVLERWHGGYHAYNKLLKEHPELKSIE